MTGITGYHAHVYFDKDSVDQATAFCDRAGERLGLSVGRKHRRLIGPHPRWSCQLAFAPGLLADVLPWLALNRGGLTIFIHPLTGDVLADHTDHAIWMGTMETLHLDFFH